jgi:hypothetical protein
MEGNTAEVKEKEGIINIKLYLNLKVSVLCSKMTIFDWK